MCIWSWSSDFSFSNDIVFVAAVIAGDLAWPVAASAGKSCPAPPAIRSRPQDSQRRVEHGFGEYGFKLRRPLKSGVALANQTKERSVHELFTGAFRNKFNVNRACFAKEKHQNSQKNGRNSNELFVLALSLVWFAGATPDKRGILKGDV